MLVYRKQSVHMKGFFQILQYLLANNSIDIIAQDFNYDILKVSENKLLDIFKFQKKLLDMSKWKINQHIYLDLW